MTGYERQQAIRAKCFHPSGFFVKFNKTDVEQSIPDRFEQIAAKYPARLAVKTKTCALTYQALNEMANRIARAILPYGEKCEEPVAVLLQKSAPAIGTILGVLKAGKMYLVLDASFPSE